MAHQNYQLKLIVVTLALCGSTCKLVELWNETCRIRIGEAVALARELDGTLRSTVYPRPPIFSGQVPVPGEATFFYAMAEAEMPPHSLREDSLLAETVTLAHFVAQPAALELLDRYKASLQQVEAGITSSSCGPWPDFGKGSPDPKVHEFLASLLMLRSRLRFQLEKAEDGIQDLLGALEYAQDICRFTRVQVCRQMVPIRLRGLAMTRAMIQSPLTGPRLVRFLKDGLLLLDELDPGVDSNFRATTLETLLGLKERLETELDTRSRLEKILTGPLFWAAGTDQAEKLRRRLQGISRIRLKSLEPHRTMVSTKAFSAGSLAVGSLLESEALLPDSFRTFGDQGTRITEARRLTLLLASLRLHHETTGKFPLGLKGLKGRQLRRIPFDPWTGLPFHYRLTNRGPVLWSSRTGERETPYRLEPGPDS